MQMKIAKPTPEHIQNIVDGIMAKNHEKFAGWTMTLGSDTAPEGDPTTQTPPVGQGETYFTQSDIDKAIEKARQQEKDKLYGKVDSLQSKLTEWEAREQERAAAEADARKQAVDEARRKEEDNLSAKELLTRKEQEWQERLNTTEKSFEDRLAQMNQEREQERALLEKEREFASLQAYTTSRLADESNNIAPQFHDFITGRTKEEIDQSIAIAKAKSAEVAEQVQAALQAARSQQRGVNVSGYAPVGPMEFESGTRQYSATDIQNMDMAEYAKHRQSLIGGGGANNRGLFG